MAPCLPRRKRRLQVIYVVAWPCAKDVGSSPGRCRSSWDDQLPAVSRPRTNISGSEQAGNARTPRPFLLCRTLLVRHIMTGQHGGEGMFLGETGKVGSGRGRLSKGAGAA